ncbi:MAG TPA: prolyl oligopeptidase family serine peptidase, partial [Saprospiraceae bacterium]|nr:prolyl oligopeptidase family serine peptidase [Saprospiraceae bacterium]
CYEDSTQKKMVEEKKKIKYKARVYTDFPVRNWDKWLDEKQTHLYVQFAHSDSAARNLFKTVEISKASGFSYLQSCWAPDGKGVIFAATTEKNTAAYQEPRSQLYHVSLSGDDARILTGDSWEYSAPECSPDGKYLYAFGNATNNNKVYNLNRLVRFDWPAMTNRKVLAENLDRPIHQFLPREDRILLSVEDQGRDRIYSLSPDGGTLQRLDQTALGCLTNISCSSSGTPVIVCQQESTLSPPEIARINADGTTTLLTRFNVDKLNALDMDAGQTLWFKSKRGKNIRSLMIRPPGFDPAKKYPLFIVIHGGPAGSWKESWSYRWNYQLLAKPGYVLLMTDFTGSTGYGERFSQDIQFDPFKGPGEEIQEAASDAIKRFPFIDADRQAAGGASYGGHLANWLQATTRHYKCLISHAGLVNSISQWGTSDYIFGREVMNGGVPWGSSKIWREQNPFRYADQFKTPMLVTIGELDYRVPVNNSLENWNILQRNKIPSKLIVFPDENHWILKGENSRFFYYELQAWLAQYLK